MHTILVIDDDIQILRLVRDYLGQAGFRVLSAANA
jgi:DNA-binding response OmpR family regulator